MKVFAALVLFLDAYAIVYYRLLVKHHYEKAHGVRETPFAAIFSFPPYTKLPESAKKYARRYWVTVAILIACVTTLAYLSDFSYLAYYGDRR